MTIETRRVPFLPWDFPFNARELRPGESATVVNFLSEGAYFWRIMALDEDGAKTIHERPYHLNGDAGFESFEPEITESVAERERINTFGPENRNWRWMERWKRSRCGFLGRRKLLLIHRAFMKRKQNKVIWIVVLIAMVFLVLGMWGWISYQRGQVDDCVRVNVDCYSCCDFAGRPLSKIVDNHDNGLPLFIRDLLRNVAGLAGL